MPLEVKELIIKVTVGDDQDGGGTSPSGGNNESNESDMVQKIVEKVLAILEEKAER